LSLKKQFKLEILFDLLIYAEKEAEYAPWTTINTALTHFNKMARSDKQYDAYQFYIITLVKNIYEKLGITDKETDRHFDKYIRIIAAKWACTAGLASCIDETNKKLKDLVENGKEVEPNMQSTIYCNGLLFSGDKEFNYLFNRLMSSQDQAERQLLMASLGCAQDAKHLKKLAESSIDSGNTLRVQERLNVLKSIYSQGKIGLNVAIEFLNEKYNEYAELTPGFGLTWPLNDAIVGMSATVVDDELKEKMMSLLEKVKNHEKVDKNLPEVVERLIKDQLNAIKENRETLFSYMNEFKASRTDPPKPGSAANLAISFITIALPMLFAIHLIF